LQDFPVIRKKRATACEDGEKGGDGEDRRFGAKLQRAGKLHLKLDFCKFFHAYFGREAGVSGFLKSTITI
jgi:hypothetical protein